MRFHVHVRRGEVLLILVITAAGWRSALAEACRYGTPVRVALA